MVELYDLSRKHHSLKSPYIINSQMFEVVPRDGPIFHKLHMA